MDGPGAAGACQRYRDLAVFAPLVVVSALIGLSTPVTQGAAWTYVIARLAHYVIYTAGIPVLRTLAFLAGACATVVIGAVVLFNGV